MAIDKRTKEFSEPVQKEKTVIKTTVKNAEGMTREEIKQLVKIETNKSLASIKQELNEKGYKIAEDLANGMTDQEILFEHEIDETALKEYYNNPSFIAEYNRAIYNSSFSNKNNRVRFMNRVLEKMKDRMFVEDPEFFNKIAPDKFLDLFGKLMKQQESSIEGDKPQVQIDITQLITNNIKEMKRIQEDTDGKLIIQSDFKTLPKKEVLLDQNGNVLKE